MRQVDFSDLDDAALKVMVADPSNRSAWARRWVWKIDRTVEYARRCEKLDTPAGLLAGAAVSLLEAQNLSEGDEVDGWSYEMKVREAKQLIARALERLP